ncbi:MAG: hypothetical protein IJR53_09525 [Bacteroidales bacterium]|nr:hypothetical protein [Bacteroidales bacterium]
MKNKDSIKLFLTREFKELRGKNNLNLWILAGVFSVSVLVIGFGSSSISYLRYKMDDPFINWVDINMDQLGIGADKMNPVEYLHDKEIQKRFHFVDPQPNYVHYRSFAKSDGSGATQFDGRSIAAWGINAEGKKSINPILDKILSPSNVINKRNNALNDNDLGVIITDEMARKLGYERPPAFVAFWTHQDVGQCEEAGLGCGVNGCYPAYVPVIAVVRQLPGMNAFLFTNRYWSEIYSNDPFSPVLEENNDELLICGENNNLLSLMKLAKKEGFETEIKPYYESWKEMCCLHISTQDNLDERIRRYNELYKTLTEKASSESSQCVRVYAYRHAQNDGGREQYYSIHMLSLDSVRSFAEDLYKRCGLNQDITNVEAKENFNFVQRMGMVLSIGIIIIVALFISVFIYFMLQSHFQKIQRNLGTFKAFGVDNNTLEMIYTRLILRMVLIAFVSGGIFAAIVSKVWKWVSVIEAGFPWVNVFVWWNVWLLLLALIAAVLATLIVSRKMLCKTPGDLIYERN